MRAGLLATLAAFGLVLALLALGGVPSSVPGRPVPRRSAAATTPRPRVEAPPTKGPTRNLFEYERDPPSEPSAPPHRAVEPAPLPSVSPPALAVKLVGIVTRGGEPRAALSRGGEVVILGPGEEIAGYTILSVDEDEGVRLRDAAGAETTLKPPRDQ